MTILTQDPTKYDFYLRELSRDLDDTCWEIQVTVVGPLKECSRLLRHFQVTERGRAAQVLLTDAVGSLEGLTRHLQARADQIPKALSGEEEIEIPLVAIG